MPLILTIHMIVGLLVVLAAVALIWRYQTRRITLYLVTLQILLGIGVIASGYRPPPLHWLLAVIAWALYMGANALTKRAPAGSKLPIGLAIVASLLVLATYGIGQHALKAGM
jgi:hypothetical protein